MSGMGNQSPGAVGMDRDQVDRDEGDWQGSLEGTQEEVRYDGDEMPRKNCRLLPARFVLLQAAWFVRTCLPTEAWRLQERS